MSDRQDLNITVGGVIVGVCVLRATITPVVFAVGRGVGVIAGFLGAPSAANTVGLPEQVYRDGGVQYLGFGVDNLVVGVVNGNAL